MKQLIEYAKSFIGVAYIWGGAHPAYGYDCSGLIQEILASVGMDPKGDQTSQALHDHFSENGEEVWHALPGALMFYGKSKKEITHIAFCISPYQLIEAGGGGPNCTDLSKSIAAGAAHVRIRPVDHRKDLVAMIRPHYAEWIMQMELPIG